MKKNILEKTSEYEQYIYDHISNVEKVWDMFYEVDHGLDSKLVQTITTNILDHDKSKFTNEEFNSYREWFYPTEWDFKNRKKSIDAIRSRFNISCNLHYQRNPHHWQFWVQANPKSGMESHDIPLEYIIEMICDWSAMSLKFKDTPSSHYKLTKDAMILSDNTVTTIEKWLPIFDEIVNNYFNKEKEND